MFILTRIVRHIPLQIVAVEATVRIQRHFGFEILFFYFLWIHFRRRCWSIVFITLLFWLCMRNLWDTVVL